MTEVAYYLHTEIVAQTSAIATEKEAEKSSWRVERVTHPCVESTYLLSLLSSPGYLHLGSTLVAPAIP